MTPTSDNSVLSDRPTTTERLRRSFKDWEYADAYARSALNAYIATQIKVIREQRGWTQGRLADEAEMKQPRIAVMEDVNYSSWSTSTLWRLAQAFHLRLRVSFEEFGTLPHEIDTFNRKSLERLPLEEDPFIAGNVQNQVARNPRSFLNVLSPAAEVSIADNISGWWDPNSSMSKGTVIHSLGDIKVQRVWVGNTSVQQGVWPISQEPEVSTGCGATVHGPAISQELPTI
jgi:transcriptional regulator with XRE-family HTH domain